MQVMKLRPHSLINVIPFSAKLELILAVLQLLCHWSQEE